MSNDDTQNQTVDGPAEIRSLREAAKAGRAATDELSKVRKENLFLRAGIPTEGSRISKMFFDGWEGDDIEALRKEALELNLLPQPSEGDAVAEAAAQAASEATQQQGFRESVATGKVPDPTQVPTPDPTDVALDTFHKDRDAGIPQRQAAQKAFATVLVAGAKGDPRVIFDPAAYAIEAAQHSVNGQIT